MQTDIGNLKQTWWAMMIAVHPQTIRW